MISFVQATQEDNNYIGRVFICQIGIQINKNQYNFQNEYHISMEFLDEKKYQALKYL